MRILQVAPADLTEIFFLLKGTLSHAVTKHYQQAVFTLGLWLA